MDFAHLSVLPEEVWHYLKPRKDQELMIDGTLGEGGHSELFLSRSESLRLVGLDADPRIIEIARKRLEPYGDRVRLFRTWFNQFFQEYPLGGERPDTVLLDLGISVFHYAKGERGFSFRSDEPLDMRLNDELEVSAGDIVNTYPEEELANLIYRFGEERYSRRIARAICRERAGERVETAEALADIISRSVPAGYRRGRLHPATRTFQALRIAVNGELARLESALSCALDLLEPNGRLGVISFHSLEDRIVKWFFREKAKGCVCPPEQPRCTCEGKPVVEILTKRPVVPTEEEVRRNPPSRSSKFRVVRKLPETEV